MKYKIGWGCNRCHLCASICPEGAIKRAKDNYIITASCKECGKCLAVCPLGIIVAAEDEKDF